MLIFSFLLACADITKVEDGQVVGDVVILKDFFTSVQLLDAGDRVVLFDGGYREDTVEEQLIAQGQSLESVTDVFLTHGHPDHLAAVPFLPNATVYAFEDEAPLIEEESGGAVTVDTFLTSGEALTVGTATVQAFLVPGHTPGSAVYLANTVLILGDTTRVNADGEFILGGGKNSEDPELQLANVRALALELEPRASEIEWLVPAHTAPVQGLQPLLDL